MVRYQDDNFLFDEEFEKEMARFENLPGGIEYSESIGIEMEKRMGPHMAEFVTLAEKRMDKVMGDAMGGVMTGVGEAMGVPLL